jgi:polysaccharide deacetylase family protein (PEP-CTERM system associated)
MSIIETPKRHILTVALEDYFQVGAFNQVIPRGQWYRFDTRLDRTTDRTLELLKRHNIKATFFILGWIAERFPELVRRVADSGHEIASKGYYHRSVKDMSPEEFREDCLRAQEALEDASGKKVLGYRVANGWFHPTDLWALDVLAELGYAYDSSIAAIGKRFPRTPDRRFLHQHQHGDLKIHELPISASKVFGMQIPISGGNYFRQIPSLLIRRAIRHWDQHVEAPLVMYFHTWELDPEQPKISAGSWMSHVRHYRNLHKMEGYLEYFFNHYRFTSAADYLGLSTELPPKSQFETVGRRPRLWQAEALDHDGPFDPACNRTPVSIVVPCYNEELILPYLANTLKSVERKLRQKYAVTFILVDDGSKDNTWEGIQHCFGNKPGFELCRHEVNKGVTAAILTGIRKARTEIVCSMDCDCTYDPHELARMIPLLTDDADLVTASPYHPEGRVRNVPGWRLRLSKSASWLYRRVLKQKLYTYTSCFRVYRRSAIMKLSIRRTNFLGIAEMIGKLDLQGSKIVEFPATLEVRMLGRSKMKTLRTILGHLRLMTRLFGLRIARWWKGTKSLPSPPDESMEIDSREFAVASR